MVVCVICTVIAQRFLYSLLYYYVLRLSSSPQTVLIPNIFTRQYISLHGYPLCNLYSLITRRITFQTFSPILINKNGWILAEIISFYVILLD